MFKKALKRIYYALRFLPAFLSLLAQIVVKRPVGISAPYFNEETLKDGYYRRIKAIDGLLDKRLRIYFTRDENSVLPRIEKPCAHTIIYHYDEQRSSHKKIRNLFIFFTGKIYCHSIYQVCADYFEIPFLKLYLDVHGIVPEEEYLRGNYEISEKMNEIEKNALKKAKHIFVVTEAMAQFLINKHGSFIGRKYTVLPIYDKSLSEIPGETKKLPNGACTVVYAGGCAKWQKIELMQEVIYKTASSFIYKICVPCPDEFWSTWRYGDRPLSLTVESKTYSGLCKDVYSKASYGFVLRDDIAVNNVACPTKISEYLEHDIIPVVNTPNIGDFNSMGMVYLSLEDFLGGNLLSPEEYEAGILKNRRLLTEYNKIYNSGCVRFKKIFSL